MIPKSGYRFSEKIMLQDFDGGGVDADADADILRAFGTDLVCGPRGRY